MSCSTIGLVEDAEPIHPILRSDQTILSPTTDNAVYGFGGILTGLQRNWTLLVGDKKTKTILSHHINTQGCNFFTRILKQNSEIKPCLNSHLISYKGCWSRFRLVLKAVATSHMPSTSWFSIIMINIEHSNITANFLLHISQVTSKLEMS